MNEGEFSINTKSRQLGFHYYKDAAHFDEPSIDYWVPKLRASGTRWLVIYISAEEEIPEYFIRSLTNSKIEAIPVLGLSISNPPDKDLFRQRMAYYHHIGIHMVQFFNYPNMQENWTVDEWIKPNLVRRFIEKYAEYALICIREKVIPVFPLLEPGGDYWDLTFFRSAVKYLAKDYRDTILPNLVFSASAALNKHPVDWNIGGPEAYGDLVPYTEAAVDHRGFHLYKWYQQTLKKELGKTYPMILFNAGQWDVSNGIFDVVTRESGQAFLTLLNRIQDVRQTGQNGLPSGIIACCMYKLPSTEALSSRNYTEKSVGKKTTLNAFEEKSPESDVRSLFRGFRRAVGFNGFAKLIRLIKRFGTNLATIFRYTGNILARGENPGDYFLVPQISDLFTPDQMQVLEQYIKLHKCKSGNDLNQALNAKSVIMMKDPALYPAYVHHQLQDQGCEIHTISFSGKAC